MADVTFLPGFNEMLIDGEQLHILRRVGATPGKGADVIDLIARRYASEATGVEEMPARGLRAWQARLGGKNKP